MAWLSLPGPRRPARPRGVCLREGFSLMLPGKPPHTGGRRDKVASANRLFLDGFCLWEHSGCSHGLGTDGREGQRLERCSAKPWTCSNVTCWARLKLLHAAFTLWPCFFFQLLLLLTSLGASVVCAGAQGYWHERGWDVGQESCPGASSPHGQACPASSPLSWPGLPASPSLSCPR